MHKRAYFGLYIVIAVLAVLPFVLPNSFYVDLAIRRLMRVTGEEPIEEASGKTFSFIAAERGITDAQA